MGGEIPTSARLLKVSKTRHIGGERCERKPTLNFTSIKEEESGDYSALESERSTKESPRIYPLRAQTNLISSNSARLIDTKEEPGLKYEFDLDIGKLG